MSTSAGKDREVKEVNQEISNPTLPQVPNAAIKNVYAPSRSIKTFDGQNYPVWVIHMQDILRERKLLKYRLNNTQLQ